MAVQFILRRFAQMTGAACALCLVLNSAQAIDLRKDLSESQFKAAGLSKLDRANQVRSTWLVCLVYVLQDAPQALIYEFIRTCFENVRCLKKNLPKLLLTNLIRVLT